MKIARIESCLTCPYVIIVKPDGVCTACLPRKHLPCRMKSSETPDWCPLEDEYEGSKYTLASYPINFGDDNGKE